MATVHPQQQQPHHRPQYRFMNGITPLRPCFRPAAPVHQLLHRYELPPAPRHQYHSGNGLHCLASCAHPGDPSQWFQFPPHMTHPWYHTDLCSPPNPPSILSPALSPISFFPPPPPPPPNPSYPIRPQFVGAPISPQALIPSTLIPNCQFCHNCSFPMEPQALVPPLASQPPPQNSNDLTGIFKIQAIPNSISRPCNDPQHSPVDSVTVPVAHKLIDVERLTPSPETPLLQIDYLAQDEVCLPQQEPEHQNGDQVNEEKKKDFSFVEIQFPIEGEKEEQFSTDADTLPFEYFFGSPIKPKPDLLHQTAISTNAASGDSDFINTEGGNQREEDVLVHDSHEGGNQQEEDVLVHDSHEGGNQQEDVLGHDLQNCPEELELMVSIPLSSLEESSLKVSISRSLIQVSTPSQSPITAQQTNQVLVMERLQEVLKDSPMLSSYHCQKIEQFFGGASDQVEQGVGRYALKKINGWLICLELNYNTMEWKGFHIQDCVAKHRKYHLKNVSLM